MKQTYPNLPDPTREPNYYDGLILGRFLAFLIDAVIVTTLTAILVLFTAFTALFFLGFVAFVVSLGYRWFTLSTFSATPGMQVMGIVLRRFDGRRLDVATAFWHSALFLFLKGMFLPLVVSLAMMIGGRYGQGLHDAICGVVAINRRPQRQLTPA